jgi:hypothetical protein
MPFLSVDLPVVQAPEVGTGQEGGRRPDAGAAGEF